MRAVAIAPLNRLVRNEPRVPAAAHAAGCRVFGVSTQDTAYQREAAQRLHLPFELLSDADLELTRALRLPTFSVAGQTLIKRLTLVGRRTRGYKVDLYREESGLGLDRRGRRRVLRLGGIRLEWYPK